MRRAVTAIKQVLNLSNAAARLLDIENPNARGHGVSLGPGQNLVVDMWTPWAAQPQDFAASSRTANRRPDTLLDLAGGAGSMAISSVSR
jgi:hypothetical protein